MPRCQLGGRAAVTPLSPQLSPPCRGDVTSRAPGLLLAGGGGRQPAPRRPSVPAGEGGGCHIPVPVVVTSLSPGLSHLCGYLRAGGTGVCSLPQLPDPAVPPSRSSRGLVCCHSRGHLSPARGVGSSPSIIDGEPEPSAAAGSGYTAGTGRGHRAGGVPAGYHLCHLVTWKGSASLARPLWDFTPVPGSGKHRIPEAPGSLRPLLGALDLSPQNNVPRLGPAPAPAHPPY